MNIDQSNIRNSEFESPVKRHKSEGHSLTELFLRLQNLFQGSSDPVFHNYQSFSASPSPSSEQMQKQAYNAILFLDEKLEEQTNSAQWDTTLENVDLENNIKTLRKDFIEIVSTKLTPLFLQCIELLAPVPYGNPKFPKTTTELISYTVKDTEKTLLFDAINLIECNQNWIRDEHLKERSLVLKENLKEIFDTTPQLEKLPDELILQIFSFLSDQDLASVALTNRTLRNLTLSRGLLPDRKAQCMNEILTTLQQTYDIDQLSELDILDTAWDKLTPKFLTNVMTFAQNLERVSFYYRMNITQSILRKIGTLQNLEDFRILRDDPLWNKKGEPINVINLTPLISCKNLKSLKLRFAAVNKTSLYSTLPHLIHLEELFLESLNLSECREFVQSLLPLRKLRVLSILDNFLGSGDFDAFCNHIPKLLELEKLDLGSNRLDDSQTEILANAILQLPKIHTLYFQENLDLTGKSMLALLRKLKNKSPKITFKLCVELILKVLIELDSATNKIDTWEIDWDDDLRLYSVMNELYPDYTLMLEKEQLNLDNEEIHEYTSDYFPDEDFIDCNANLIY